jgi:uncharacterized protein (DUF1810 family)
MAVSSTSGIGTDGACRAMSDLQRFVDAQDHGTTKYGFLTALLSTALEELQNGHKQEHWIWYVLPQIRHETATKGPSIDFAISSLDEAVGYLKHEILRNRYLETTTIILGHLTSGLSPFVLMGKTIDVQKLASSVTLFSLTAKSIGDDEVLSVTTAILDRLEHARCKVDACAMTIDWFAAQST